MKIIFCAFFCAAIFIAGPRIAAASCPGKRLSVEVEGVKKTKTSVVVRLAELRGECVPPGGVDPAKVKQKLLNAKIFTDVDVEVEELPETTVVHIDVKERWTIVPIPVFYAKGEETGGGLLVLEGNLFGRKKTLIGGATWSNLGEKYEGVYIDDSVWGSKWVIIARPLFSDRIIQRFEDEEKIYAYRRDYDMLLLIVGRRVTENFAPGLGLKYHWRGTSRVEGFPPPPEGGNMNSFLLNARYNNTKYTDYYDKGLSLLGAFEQTTPIIGSERIVSKLGIDGDFAHPLTSRVLSRTTLRMGWTWGEDEDFLDYYRIGGDVGSRGLPSTGVWVSDLVAVAEEIEEPVYRHKYGTLTLVQFFDSLFTLEDEPLRVYPAVGGGLRAYIKKLAIPAVGVDAGYSLRNYVWHFSAYIGKDF